MKRLFLTDIVVQGMPQAPLWMNGKGIYLNGFFWIVCFYEAIKILQGDLRERVSISEGRYKAVNR